MSASTSLAAAVAPLLGRCRMNDYMSTEPSGPCPLSLAAPLSTAACWDSSLLRKRVAELRVAWDQRLSVVRGRGDE